MHVSVAALTDSGHHQGRICKHVCGLKQKSSLYHCIFERNLHAMQQRWGTQPFSMNQTQTEDDY